MIEKEIKLLLTKEEYERLSKSIKFDDSFTQVNYYYDDKNFTLSNNGITLKVRLVGDLFILYFKEKHSEGNDFLITRLEYTKVLPNLPSQIGANEILALTHSETSIETLEIIHESLDFQLLGSLKTLRKKKKYDEFEMMVDKNEYLGMIDYEIELELNGGKDSVISMVKHLEELNVYDNTSCFGKYKRFIQFRKLKKQ